MAWSVSWMIYIQSVDCNTIAVQCVDVCKVEKNSFKWVFMVKIYMIKDVPWAESIAIYLCDQANQYVPATKCNDTNILYLDYTSQLYM